MTPPTPPTSGLPPGEVHLWFAFVDRPQLRDPQLLERYRAMMSDEERRRQERYLQPVHRHQALVARALVRSGLSRYAPDVEPGRWRFRANEHGRPEIAGPRVAPLRFNLSHTTGLMVLAVTLDRAVGVDVEDHRRRVESREIAHRFFAADEVRQLEAGKAPFFAFWTLKEAYIKARGAGLALPLQRFAFHLDGGRIGVVFEPRLRDRADAWRFALLGPTPQHTAALAVRSDRPLTVRVGQVVPLRGEAGLDCRVLARGGGDPG